jgi:hypothetical protein
MKERSVTFHISGLDRRSSSGGFAGEEDAELARLEQVARDALTGRMAGL